MIKCPCCGTEVEIKGLMISLDTNTVVRDGYKPVKLRNVATEFLKVLFDAYPRTLSYNQIGAKVWGGMSDIDLLSNIQAQAYYLRQQLKPIGIMPLPVFKQGYRLEILSEPKEIGSYGAIRAAGIRGQK